MIANLLSIAGSDPSGGAGVQADLKTFSALGCYGMAALTALTAQNTQGVSAIVVLEPDFVAAQIDAIFRDMAVDAVKIGMVANAALVDVVADRLTHWRPRHIVVDPVLAATSGHSLGADDVVGAIIEKLFPLATLVTPNLPETARLAGLSQPGSLAEMKVAAALLRARGAHAVLIKGGHGDDTFATDLLVGVEGEQAFSTPRIDTKNTHGTGCTLSSAIAARLAQGRSLADAVSDAKDYLTDALRAAHALRGGHGHGPVHHFHALWPQPM